MEASLYHEASSRQAWATKQNLLKENKTQLCFWSKVGQRPSACPALPSTNQSKRKRLRTYLAGCPVRGKRCQTGFKSRALRDTLLLGPDSMTQHVSPSLCGVHTPHFVFLSSPWSSCLRLSDTGLKMLNAMPGHLPI